MAYIQGYDRNQTTVFPEILDDYVPENSIIRIIDAFVHGLNLVILGFRSPYVKGRPPYSPYDLLALYLYGYLNRIRSSRRLEKETYRNVEVMWLLRKLHPDYRTIARFRKDNGKGIKEVSRLFVELCRELGLLGSQTISIDGSKFRACNNKKRNFTSSKLAKRIQAIEEKITEYMKEMDDNDKKEDDDHGENIPDNFQGSELRDKIEEMTKRLSDYQAMLKELKDSGESQISRTDPDSRSMGDTGKGQVCYNVQTVVEAESKMIIADEVTNEVNDGQLLLHMAKKGKEALGVEKVDGVADKGYNNTMDLKKCEENGITPFVPSKTARVPKSGVPKVGYRKEDFKYDAETDSYTCPRGEKLYKKKVTEFKNKRNEKYRLFYYETSLCEKCPVRENFCAGKKQKKRVISRHEHEDAKERSDARLEENPEKLKQRQMLSEHPFGTLKNWGFGQFLTRGLKSVSTEMSLSTLAYNFKRFYSLIEDDKARWDAITSFKVFHPPPGSHPTRRIRVMVTKDDLFANGEMFPCYT